MEKKTVYFYICVLAEKILDQTARHFTKAKETVCTSAPFNPSCTAIISLLHLREKNLTPLNADLFRMQLYLLL